MKYKEVLELRKKANQLLPQLTGNAAVDDITRGYWMGNNPLQGNAGYGTQGGFGFGSILPMLMMGGIAGLFKGQKQDANKVPAADTVNKAPANKPAVSNPTVNKVPVANTQQNVPVNTAPRTFISSRDNKDLTAPKPIDPTAADVNAGKKTFIQGAQQIAQRGTGAAPVKKPDNTPPMLSAYGIQYPQAQ